MTTAAMAKMRSAPITISTMTSSLFPVFISLHAPFLIVY
jgi:hypothetical protein